MDVEVLLLVVKHYFDLMFHSDGNFPMDIYDEFWLVHLYDSWHSIMDESLHYLEQSIVYLQDENLEFQMALIDLDHVNDDDVPPEIDR